MRARRLHRPNAPDDFVPLRAILAQFLYEAFAGREGTMSKAVVGYIRVSTARQGKS